MKITVRFEVALFSVTHATPTGTGSSIRLALYGGSKGEH